MKIKLVKNTDCLRIYEINCDNSIVGTEYASVLEDASKRVNIEGFRKGAVPLDVIETRMGEKIIEIVSDNLERKIVQKIIEDEGGISKIAHIGKSKPLAKYTKDSIKMSIEIEINPEVPAIKYEKIKLDLPKLELSDADLDKEVEKVLSNFATPKRIDDPNIAIQNRHIAVINFVGRIDDKIVESACANNFSIEIGSRNLIPGFEDQMVGMKSGESKTIKVTFPKDYHAKDMAGKDAEFDINVLSINEKILPDLNEEFLGQFGLKSVEEFRSRISQDIDKMYENQIKRYAKVKVEEHLRDKYSDFPIPKVFLESEISRLKPILEKNNQELPEKTRKSAKDIEKECEKKAIENICMSFIYRSIITSEKIEISKEDVEAAIMNDAMMYGKDYEKIIKMYSENPNMRNFVESRLQEDRAFDYMFGKISITRKPLNLEKMKIEIDKLFSSLKKE
ncbi:trigger factor [Candidatus Deianiraea vastatrix]|uniref:Trigger factor n=1 Tax=Candidatus Deianiraea vastatrix TaxID=2163644 RepID=A0A5B8XCB2_9RICK|nr:trigger factor [Candidatus Deianiraea vastatrix]QED22972.1 Trigger factor [Candidatus Deianiraea vastatrix]